MQGFGVTAPSVHQMVVTLDARGLVARVPGKARSIRVLAAVEDLPPLVERLGATKHYLAGVESAWRRGRCLAEREVAEREGFEPPIALRL